MRNEAHMIVTPKSFNLKDIATSYYEDDKTNAVVGLNGHLDIRPKYQRQFVYPKDKQDAVVRSVLSGYPINVMYWVRVGASADGQPCYEVLDGQQRLISLCRFMTQGMAVDFDGSFVSYGSSPEMIDSYDKLTVYVCEKGDFQTEESFEKEKLAWFSIINIAGSTLTHQEILSALKYSDWCTSAKSYFVYKDRTGSTAYSYGIQRRHQARDYLSAKNTEKTEKDAENEKQNSDVYNRQEIFETVLSWVTGHGLRPGTAEDIEKYMEEHRDEKKYPDASGLWTYFTAVMDWVWALFEGKEDRYDKNMSRVPWGILYNAYGANSMISPEYIRKRIDELSGFEVDQAGKYIYVLDEAVNGESNADTSVLHLRQFPAKMMSRMYLKQHGVCPGCGKHFSDEKDMQGDHIKPWKKGGFTDEENCQMLCADCNGAKKANEHWGQIYSRDEVIRMSETEAHSLSEGTLKSKRVNK